jgi:hypothetical protein
MCEPNSSANILNAFLDFVIISMYVSDIIVLCELVELH